MTARPSLVRSIPFWILLAGSLASVASGAVLTLDKVSTMTSTLTDGSATGVDVYAGQSWVMLGAALVGAGLVGLVAVLALAAARSLVPVAAAPTEQVEAIEVVEIVDAPLLAAEAPAAEETTAPATAEEAPAAPAVSGTADAEPRVEAPSAR